MLGKTIRSGFLNGCAAGTWTVWLVLSLSGCATVDGSLKLSGGSLGELEFKPSSCKSGQHYNFLGADLFATNPESSAAPPGAQQPTFRVVNGAVVKDPVAPDSAETPSPVGKLRIINDAVRGPVVRYFDSRVSGGYLQFTPEVCQQLTVDAENTESGDRHSSPYAATTGAMRLQCTLPDGTRATGALSFAGCR